MRGTKVLGRLLVIGVASGFLAQACGGDANTNAGDGDGDEAPLGGSETGGDGDGDDAPSGGMSATGGSDTGSMPMGSAGEGGAPPSGGRTSTGGTNSTGGMTSSGGETSSGGMTSTGGTTSMGGMGGFAPTESTAVNTPIPSGSVSITANGFGEDFGTGYSGYFFTAVDMGGSEISPENFGSLSAIEVAENKVCAFGTSAQVVNMRWDTIWGVHIGWNIGQELEGSIPQFIDVSDSQGVAFTLVQEIDAPVRFSVLAGTDWYCTDVVAGDNVVYWPDLKRDCWEAGGDAFDPSASSIDAVGWLVPSTDVSETFFDLCLGGLSIVAD